MILRTKLLCISIIFILSLNIIKCTFQENEIIEKNNKTKCTVYNFNRKHSVSLEKEKLYTDHYDSKGYLFRRDYLINKGRYIEYYCDTTETLNSAYWFSKKSADNYGFGNSYFYDKSNTILIYKNRYQRPPKITTKYDDNDRLISAVIYDRKERINKMYQFKYDWKGHLDYKLEYNKDYKKKLKKIDFTYDLFGKLINKNIYEMKLNETPMIQDGKLVISNLYATDYILKFKYGYVYNDANLIHQEIKSSSIGYILEKTIYEYNK